MALMTKLHPSKPKNSRGGNTQQWHEEEGARGGRWLAVGRCMLRLYVRRGTHRLTTCFPPPISPPPLPPSPPTLNRAPAAGKV